MSNPTVRMQARADRVVPLFSRGALLQAYGPLVYLGGQLRNGARPEPPPDLLREHLKERVLEARSLATTAGCKQEELKLAERAVLALLDEAVFSLGGEYRQAWAAKTLEFTLHQATTGGELFYSNLQRLQARAENAELKELYYLVLAAGFQGGPTTATSDVVRDQLGREIRGRTGQWTPLAEHTQAGGPPPAAAVAQPAPWMLLSAAMAFVACVTLVVGIIVLLHARDVGTEIDTIADRLTGPADTP